MNVVDQLVFRAPHGSGDVIRQAASSIRRRDVSRRWQEVLEPWLRAGGPLGRGYVQFESQAAALRWRSGADWRYDWQYAKALVGQAATLTGEYALELPELAQPVLFADGLASQETRAEHGPRRDAIAELARSAATAELLVPLLGRVLAGEQTVLLPWTEPGLPDAAVWGLLAILSMLGDTRPVSFLSYAVGRPPAVPGLFVSFRPGAALVPADQGYQRVARALAGGFAESPARLRQALRRSGLLEPADQAGRVARLVRRLPLIWDEETSTLRRPAAEEKVTLIMPPRPTPPAEPGPSAASAPTAPPARPAPRPPDTPTLPRIRPPSATAPPSAPSAPAGPAPVVKCPICPGDIEGWDQLALWQWQPDAGDYVEFRDDPADSAEQRQLKLVGAHVRCPRSAAGEYPHYLPVDYGRFGQPVHLGFVGESKSGKSHLLAAMVKAMDAKELRRYGIACRPLDHAKHQRFVEDWVNPLFDHERVLAGTAEGRDEFVDAFLVSHNGGPERPVVLFDVAGGLLRRLNAPQKFLSIASGLFFVIAPEHLAGRRSTDEAFTNVLNAVQRLGRASQTSAAVILNKADLLRFEPPVARWLRADNDALDPVELLRESADVYGYLHQRKRDGLSAPYDVCARATLHVASPTGGADDGTAGGVYPRGVTPLRVVNPLVAMLAMTGVLTGPAAERVGI